MKIGLSFTALRAAARGIRGRVAAGPLAAPADAARILDMMVARSKPFGATVTVKNGVGVINA